MSLFNLLGIARSALLTHQRAMGVTAHNIANAETPGYSRQRLDLVADTPLRSTLGAMGRGVTASGVTRARDALLDSAYRRESGLLGGSGTRYTMLQQVEGALGEPSDVGVSAALDHLFQSFSDLANDPSSGTSRELVRQAAKRFVEQVHQLNARLNEISSDALARLTSQVSEANAIAGRIAELNRQIVTAGSAGAPDLEDQRDLLIDQLSGYASVQVQSRDDGTVGVVVGGVMLVDGTQSQSLKVQSLSGGRYAVGTESGTAQVNLGEGSLGALTGFLSTTVVDVRSRLDAFVNSTVRMFNQVHRTGYTLTGATQTDFFDPDGVTAGSIALASDIEDSGDAIAAAGTRATGDGAVAVRMAALKDAAILGGRTLRQYYVDIASTVGIQVSNADQDATIHQTLLDQADSQRSAVSGVSLDEEMVLLIGQQEAYSAAARLISTINEMIQTLLDAV